MSIGKTNSIGGSYQKKTITPYNFVKNVLPDANYNALSEVEIDGVLVDPHIPIESVQDNLVKYQKVIPNNVLTYGGLSKLGGLTKKYNQLIDKAKLNTTQTINGVAFTNNNDGSITINGTATSDVYFNLLNTSQFTGLIVGHKYLLKGFNGIRVFQTISSTTGSIVNEDSILTAIGTNTYLEIRIANGTTINNVKIIPMISDLTLGYGAGNEPTTVDQFLTDYPKYNNYVEYNVGSLDYAYTKKVDITGLNIWDEEVESGYINDRGQLVADANSIRSKNYNRCIPNATYYIYGSGIRVLWYDENQNLIDSEGGIANTTKIAPNNAIYFKISLYNYGGTYNNDICINVSNASLNGTYKPSYRNALLEAKIVAIKQKLVSLGYSADVLGYGLPNVYNYIDLENKQVVLKMINVDLGSLNYTLTVSSGRNLYSTSGIDIKGQVSGIIAPNVLSSIYNAVSSSTTWKDKDVSYGGALGTNILVFVNNDYSTVESFKTAMSGVPLIYELATPITVDVSDILDNDDVIGELESGGTITFDNDEKYNLPSDVSYLVEVE